jgi:hypothetical protein
MAIMVNDNRKEFEKPKNGTYVGVVADIVDLGLVPTNFGQKPKIRIVWLLNQKDSEGNYFRVMSQVNASANEKSALFGIVKSVLGVVPPPPFDAEVLLGRSNELFVLNEPDSTGTKTFANVKAIMPLSAGTQPMQIPATFVRAKDQQKNGPTAPGKTATTPTAAPVAVVSEVPDEDIPF